MLRSLPWRFKLLAAAAPALVALFVVALARRAGLWTDLPSGLLAYCVAAALVSLLLLLHWRRAALRYFRRRREADDRLARLALCANMQRQVLAGYVVLAACVAAAQLLLALLP